jgi:hypothetical protein
VLVPFSAVATIDLSLMGIKIQYRNSENPDKLQELFLIRRPLLARVPSEVVYHILKTLHKANRIAGDQDNLGVRTI